MTTTSSFVLNNIETGIETKYDTLNAATGAVDGRIGLGDAWAIFETKTVTGPDCSRGRISDSVVHLVAHGRGQKIRNQFRADAGTR